MTTKAIEAGARAIRDVWHKHSHMPTVPGEQEAKACIEAAIASGELVPASAVAAERERCAAKAENPGFIEAQDTEWDLGVNYAKKFIANAIRAMPKIED